MTPEKAFNLALRYLSRSAKTMMEMQRYLEKKAVEQDTIESILTRLTELNYIDDRAYARQFIENRVRFKPKSVFALGYELRHKGVDPAIAEELLAELDDAELAFKAIEPKLDLWHRLDDESRKKKTMNYLRYRGFSHDICYRVWEKCLTKP